MCVIVLPKVEFLGSDNVVRKDTFRKCMLSNVFTLLLDGSGRKRHIYVYNKSDPQKRYLHDTYDVE